MITPPASHQTPQRWTVIYHGRVQGVGFRQTTAYFVRRYPVVGYVLNRSDGTVELVAECDAATFKALQAEIAAHFLRNIERCDVSEEPATGEFSRFEVRH